MKTISSDLDDDLAEEVTTACRLFKVTRADGTILRFTDGDEPVTIGGDGTYRADLSFNCSAISSSMSDTSQQSFTIDAVMDDDGFAEFDLRARLYTGATAEVFLANRTVPGHGVVTLFKGVFGTVTIVNGFVTVEVGSQSANRNPTIGFEMYSATCRASLGDVRCGVSMSAIRFAFTVSSYTQRHIVMSTDPGVVPNRYRFGFITWLTGPNTGITNKVIGSSGTSILLADAPPVTPVNGDTGYVYPGCDKLITTCRDSFNNVVNFRGEADVPNGQDVNNNRTTVGTQPPGGGNRLV